MTVTWGTQKAASRKGKTKAGKTMGQEWHQMMLCRMEAGEGMVVVVEMQGKEDVTG